MKRFTFLALVFLTSHHLLSQQISESIVSYKEKFNPIFSNEFAVLTLDFFKQYQVGISDTSFAFVMGIQKNELELENISLGTTVFSRGVIGGVAGSYKINGEQASSVLDKESFSALYTSINDVYLYVSDLEKFKRSKNDILATSGIGDIQIGGEFKPKRGEGNQVKFYFKIGESVTYEMSKSQFYSITKMLREIKLLWGIE